jgi:hypothetical protein
MIQDYLPIYDPCPHCQSRIEDVRGYKGRFEEESAGEYTVRFNCPHCKGPIVAYITVAERIEYDYTTNLHTDGEPPEPEPPSVEEVNRFLRKKPSLVMFDKSNGFPDGPYCETCGKQACSGQCNAQHLISQGWKVIPDYPSYHVQCPECR